MATEPHTRSTAYYIALTSSSLLLLSSGGAVALDKTEDDYHLKLLGKYVFFDKISSPQRMACVTCHNPTTGGTGNASDINLGQVTIIGANPHTVGNLKPPTNAYASLIEPFHSCTLGAPQTGRFCGGNFWDGRAEGRADGALFPATASKHIGNEVLTAAVPGYAKYFGPTSDQALNPMPNPVEQNIDRQSVCRHVAAAPYAPLYPLAWGLNIDCGDTPVANSNPPEKAFDISFKRIMLAVGAWQHSAEVNSFSSKRDIALREELACVQNLNSNPAICTHPNFLNSPGKFPLVGLTDQENLGHDLFYNSRPVPRFAGLPVTNCSFCHTDNPATDDGSEPRQLYADDAYHNIGTPANPALPAAASPGLNGHTGLATTGFFKTPTLRNVDKRKVEEDAPFVKAYTHNGWFKSLASLVHFYNTANVANPANGKTRCPGTVTSETDALANNCWPAPEHAGAAIPFLIGNIGMNAEQEAALVAYLETLTDTVTAKPPKPYK